MRKYIAIKLIEFAMFVYENSDTKWTKEDYEIYNKLQSKLKGLK